MIEWWSCVEISMKINGQKVDLKPGSKIHGKTVETMKVNDFGLLCVHFKETDDAYMYKPDSFIMKN